MSLNLTPLTLREAMSHVRQHHRHLGPPQGGLFAIGAERSGEIVGVAIVGRPVARHLADGRTAEVTRLCTIGAHNACSLLYGAAWRAARAMGYRRLVTYTLATEPGTSLRAAGWTCVAEVRAASWHRASGPRLNSPSPQPKFQWEVIA